MTNKSETLDDFLTKHLTPFIFDRRAFWYAMPEVAVVWENVDQMQRAVISSGSPFFDADTMEFFKSRLLHDLFGGRFFLTSERDVTAPRHYRVRWVYPHAGSTSMLQVNNLETQFSSLAKARNAARTLAALVDKYRDENNYIVTLLYGNPWETR